MILGVIYEFSTRDSPINRPRLQSVLTAKMGREKYIDSLTKLRSHPHVRDFEVIPQKLDSSGNLPEVFFDATFVDFFKDNFSRLTKALDRDPGMEISVVANGVQKGISRDLVDSLREQLAEKEKALQELRDEATSLGAKLGAEQIDNRKSKEASAAELARIKNINDAIQRNHEQEVRSVSGDSYG
jgi:intracellular protein transport protein USO1